MGLSRIAAIGVVACALGSVGQGQQPVPPSGAPDVPVRAHLGEGRDVHFVANYYTSMTLLQIRRDGTFAEYMREHMFVATSDEGRWTQRADGQLALCSHFRFRPINAHGLNVYPRGDDVARLPALADAIERLLEAQPAKKVFRRPDLLPVFLRCLLTEDPDKRPPAPPAGALKPTVMGDSDRATRIELGALAAAIRARLADRDGSLLTYTVMQLGQLTWLSRGEPDVEKEMLEQYRHHAKGPFLPGLVPVAVDAPVFRELLGTRQSFMYYTEMNEVIPRDAPLEDMRGTRIDAPQCGSYRELERPLPVPARQPVPRH